MIIMTNGDMIAMVIILGMCALSLIALAEIETRVLNDRKSTDSEK